MRIQRSIPVSRCLSRSSLGLGSRFGFTLSLLGFPLFSACALTPKRQFDQLTETLNQRFGVSASRFVGPRMVIVLPDHHLPEVETRNRARLRALEQLVDLQIVGFENVFEIPRGPLHQELLSRLRRIFPLKPPTPGESRKVSPHAYAEFFADPAFHAIGLEDAEYYFTTQILMILTRTCTEIFETAVVSERHFVIDPYAIGRLERIRRAEATLMERGLRIPILDTSRFREKLTSADDIFLRLDLEEVRYLRLHLEKLYHLLFYPTAERRNQLAVAKLAAEMERQNLQLGAIMMGRGHLDDSTMTFPLQTCLIAEGLSYIVLRDP